MMTPRAQTDRGSAAKSSTTLRRGVAFLFSRRRRGLRRRGTALILIAVLMTVFLAVAAFWIDVAYMELVRAEMRTSTDAAARAAVEILGQTQDAAAARSKAVQIAALNKVAGQPLILESPDIVFGSSRALTNGSIEFLPGVTPYRSVRVTGRKLSGSPSGSVPLFFGSVVGRPTFEPRMTSTATFMNRDICLVIDRSDSMKWQPWYDLRNAVYAFTAALRQTPQDESVGLASYASTAYLDQALTSNLTLIDQRMANIWPLTSQTNIGGGIDMGRYILINGAGSGVAQKAIIVMTDGWHNVGTDPLSAAQRAVNDGIVIHTITFGWYADQALMRTIASMTGGKSYHAPDAATLTQIYREIAFSFRNILTE